MWKALTGKSILINLWQTKAKLCYNDFENSKETSPFFILFKVLVFVQLYSIQTLLRLREIPSLGMVAN